MKTPKELHSLPTTRNLLTLAVIPATPYPSCSFLTIILFIEIKQVISFMPDEDKNPVLPKPKPVGWKIPESLRHRLNSHMEYLSVEKETSVGAMISPWLEERLLIEERKRALRTLEIEEKDLPKPSRQGARKA